LVVQHQLALCLDAINRSKQTLCQIFIAASVGKMAVSCRFVIKKATLYIERGLGFVKFFKKLRNDH
jgi:hypothetical protein